jgi:putative ABC transport system ATP-binding protein
VSLSVDEGELVAVMGPSGSGKSTLLTIAGGLEDPSSGDVTVHGRLVSAMGRDERAAVRRSEIGYVFQELNLLRALTVVENVALPMELNGASSRAARTEASETLSLVGLADKVDRFPDDLSGGERQRVAIARALVGAQRLVLADEPTGAQDSVNGEQIMRLLRQACDRGASSVIVTHDAQLAAWADRVLFLRDGRAVDSTRPPAPLESMLERRD